MTKNTFETFINLSIEKGKKENIIYNNGLDLINFLDEYSKLISILLKSIYGEDVSDLITDFIIDNIYDEIEDKKQNYIIYDKDSNIIADCSTIDGLYNYAEEIRLDLIKEKFSYDIKKSLTSEEKQNLINQLFSKI